MRKIKNFYRRNVWQNRRNGREGMMNVANLQLEGLIMAIASVNRVIVAKGLLSGEEVDLALRRAEASLTSEERQHEDLSPSNRDAVVFPIRVLQLANRTVDEQDICSFSELVKMVGQTKYPYNDQL
jgi:hypothetical protein